MRVRFQMLNLKNKINIEYIQLRDNQRKYKLLIIQLKKKKKYIYNNNNIYTNSPKIMIYNWEWVYYNVCTIYLIS